MGDRGWIWGGTDEAQSKRHLAHQMGTQKASGNRSGRRMQLNACTNNIPRSFVANLPRRSARAIVIADTLSERRIREWFLADAVTRRILQALLAQINDFSGPALAADSDVVASNFQ
jgi:hypothetical protein